MAKLKLKAKFASLRSQFAKAICSLPTEQGKQLSKMEFQSFGRVVITTGVWYNNVYVLIPMLGYLPCDPVEPEVMHSAR